jgi:DNA-binding transcriptional LysR family regulator
MNVSPPADWALIRVFLALAETGSLAAAARRLGLSQPTLSRQLRAVEAAFGGPLFRRHARGYALTDAGNALLPEARSMAEAAARFALRAAGQGEPLAGSVRIAASRIMASLVLPPALAATRAALPELALEISASDGSDNLLFGEADIAIRMYRPAQQGLVAQRIGTLALGLFASRGYVARRGHPAAGDTAGHDWIGYDSNPAMIDGMRKAGMRVDRDSFAFRSDDQVACWRMVQAGCGIGVGPLRTGAADPDLVRVLPDIEIPGLPVWLAAAEALRHSPRVAQVWAALAEGLGHALGR